MGGRESGRGTRIETRQATQRRVIWLAPLAYVLAWGGLFAASSLHWFLPAGLRMATLWLLPRRYWWAMAISEALAISLVAVARHAFQGLPPMLLVAILPWCVCALIVWRFGKTPGAAPTPGSMMRFLSCGLGASISTALLLVMILQRSGGGLPKAPVAMLYSFAIGDFIGILVVAPLARMLLGQVRGPAVPWRAVFADGLVLLPVLVTLALASVPMRSVPLYPVILAVFPLLWIAFKHGWRAAGVALALLSAAVNLIGAGGIGASLPLPQLHLLIAAAGFAALSLGAASDTLRTQGRALRSTIDMLSTRTRALSDTANRLVSQQEEERRRIGGELHDQLGQDMTAIATRLRLVERAPDAETMRAGMRAIAALVDDAHQHLRDTIQSLHPLVLHRFGLARALAEGPMRELARDHSIAYQATIEGDVDRLPPEVATAIYRICQEAATNGVRHGCGGRILIFLSAVAHAGCTDVRLRIEDDGGAFDIDPGNVGLGLQNIRDRADAIGAAYVFDPRTGHPRHLLDVGVGSG